MIEKNMCLCGWRKRIKGRNMRKGNEISVSNIGMLQSAAPFEIK